MLGVQNVWNKKYIWGQNKSIEDRAFALHTADPGTPYCPLSTGMSNF